MTQTCNLATRWRAIKWIKMVSVDSVIEDKPACPECGDWLSLERYIDEDTGEIIIQFWCEGAGSDEFNFLILTGLTNEDLSNFKEEEKTIIKNMKIKLLKRKPDLC